jgi:pimeloyl-ACP methyl ester carboxylesterase
MTRSTEMGVLRSTVVLVHGGWHGSWCWAQVVPLLDRRGISVRTIDLPSIDADPDDRSTLSGDAAAVAALLDDLQAPALLCGHSYGGMVITQAAASRQDVARLVYLCAFMPDTGESLLSIIGERAPWIVVLEDGRWLPDLDQAAATFYADCDAATQRASIARLRPMPTAPVEEPVSAAPWRDIPSTYVVCTQDMAIPVEWQRELFAPRADDVVELEASHSPFFSRPSAVADLLAERAGA